MYYLDIYLEGYIANGVVKKLNKLKAGVANFKGN